MRPCSTMTAGSGCSPPIATATEAPPTRWSSTTPSPERPVDPAPMNPVRIDRRAARPGAHSFTSTGALCCPSRTAPSDMAAGSGFRNSGTGPRRRSGLSAPSPSPRTGDWPYPQIHTLNRAGRLEVIDGIAAVRKHSGAQYEVSMLVACAHGVRRIFRRQVPSRRRQPRRELRVVRAAPQRLRDCLGASAADVKIAAGSPSAFVSTSRNTAGRSRRRADWRSLPRRPQVRTSPGAKGRQGVAGRQKLEDACGRDFARPGEAGPPDTFFLANAISVFMLRSCAGERNMKFRQVAHRADDARCGS